MAADHPMIIPAPFSTHEGKRAADGHGFAAAVMSPKIRGAQAVAWLEDEPAWVLLDLAEGRAGERRR